MGGIYIPDLSLPGDGDFELWIAVKKDGSFTYNVRGAWRAGNQKAVPVPPHGDLIDRDALYKEFERSGWFNNADRDIAEDVLLDAHTVIPAEGVYGQYTDTAGNFHWCGTHSGEHTIKAEEVE